MKLARVVVDVLLFTAVIYVWPIVFMYMYVHFAHPELVYLTRRLDNWDSWANPMIIRRHARY